MLIIRNEQIARLRESALQSFEEGLIAHVCALVPQVTRAGNEACIRTVVRSGVKRAERYGLTNRGPVRLFVELMCLIGFDFDTDPQLGRLNFALETDDFEDQQTRAELLYSEAIEYFITVVGENDSNLIAALRRASMLRLEDLTLASPDFEKRMLWTFSRLYPQKYSYAGEVALLELVTGPRITTTAGVDAASSGFLSVLMFLFGSGVAGDPLYNYGMLTNNSSGEIARIADRLEEYNAI